MNCPKCKCRMKEGQALENILGGVPDFIGDNHVCTISATGDAKLIKVMKCPKCGLSRYPLRVRFCWHCSRKLRGNQFVQAVIDGHSRVMHKQCHKVGGDYYSVSRM